MLLSMHHINTSHHHSTTIYSADYSARLSSEDCKSYRWRFKAYLVSIERGNQGAIGSSEHPRRKCLNWSRSEAEVNVPVLQQLYSKFQFQDEVKIGLDLFNQEEFRESKSRSLIYFPRRSRSSSTPKQIMSSSS